MSRKKTTKSTMPAATGVMRMPMLPADSGAPLKRFVDECVAKARDRHVRALYGRFPVDAVKALHGLGFVVVKLSSNHWVESPALAPLIRRLPTRSSNTKACLSPTTTIDGLMFLDQVVELGLTRERDVESLAEAGVPMVLPLRSRPSAPQRASQTAARG